MDARTRFLVSQANEARIKREGAVRELQQALEQNADAGIVDAKLQVIKINYPLYEYRVRVSLYSLYPCILCTSIVYGSLLNWSDVPVDTLHCAAPNVTVGLLHLGSTRNSAGCLSSAKILLS